MGNQCAVYDKAKYHFDSVEKAGLPEEHAYHHTSFFLSWLVRNNLMSDWYESECEEQVADFRIGKSTINQLYEWWDTCLMSDMLSEEGNAFASAYFDFDKGMYLNDYHAYLQKELPSEFHVPYTPENEAIIHAVISRRFEDWKQSHG